MSTLRLQDHGPATRGAVRFFKASALPALVLAALVALPLLSLGRLALQGDAELWPHLARFVVPTAFAQTFALLAGVAILTTIAGGGTAWLVTTFDFPGRRAALWVLPLPLAFPTYIAAYIYADLAGAPMRTLAGAIFVFSAVLYPYVYLAARAMMQTQYAAFIEAARMLGANPLRLLREITAPMARPALAVGIALVMLETLNDIGASEYLGVQTLTLSIFTTWLNRGSLGGAAQISVALLLMVAAFTMIERYGRRGEVAVPIQDSRGIERIAQRGARGWLCAAACLMPVLLGFIVPAIYLCAEVLRRGLIQRFDADLLRLLGTTITLSAIATVAILVLALAAVVPLRRASGALGRTGVTIAGLGYAIPGTVLALGLLSPLVAFDEMLNAISQMLGGKPLGLIVAGSSAALVIAYCVRFLAVGLGFVQSGLARLPSDLDEAARMLGARPLTLFRNIQMPLMRPALWGAALLIFVDCLKELPVTLLLRPLNVETLSTHIYQYATRGNFEEGALAALLIVAAGLLPVARLVRLTEGGQRLPPV